MDADIPLLVDGEEVGPPVVQVVDLGGVGNCPAFHGASFSRLRLRLRTTGGNERKNIYACL